MKESEQTVQAYYYLVKYFGFKNTVAAFLEWRDKYFKDEKYSNRKYNNYPRNINMFINSRF